MSEPTDKRAVWLTADERKRFAEYCRADTWRLNWLDTLQGRTRGVSWPIVTDMHASAGTWCIYLRTGIGSQIAAQGHGMTIREAIDDAMSQIEELS